VRWYSCALGVSFEYGSNGSVLGVGRCGQTAHASDGRIRFTGSWLGREDGLTGNWLR
jgi:hypothetical protein